MGGKWGKNRHFRTRLHEYTQVTVVHNTYTIIYNIYIYVYYIRVKTPIF
jgi:hypothetical protein